MVLLATLKNIIKKYFKKLRVIFTPNCYRLYS